MNEESPIEIYNNKIVPKIKEIDLFLKTNDIMLEKEVAKILEISEYELSNILIMLNEKNINNKNFLKVMLNGSSFICEMLKREIECGIPYYYNAKNLSYIYKLDYEKVLNAYNFLNLKFITSNQIPIILMQI